GSIRSARSRPSAAMASTTTATAASTSPACAPTSRSTDRTLPPRAGPCSRRRVIVVYILLSLVLGFALLILVLRIKQGMHEGAVGEAIRAYVTERGGSVVFDATGMTVKGPRGQGREKLTALMIMCSPESRATWKSSIGFSLRKYMPDAVEEMFAKNARERLAK